MTHRIESPTTTLPAVGRSLGQLSLAALFAVSLAAAPVAFDADSFLPVEKSAVAKNGNGGNGGNGNGGNGNGGNGNGGQGNGGNGNGSAAGGQSNGNSADKGSTSNGKNGLGSLNAAHASPTAMAHAAPNSMVGQIAAYGTAAAAIDPTSENSQEAIDEAGAALAGAANKSIDKSVVEAVNGLLGIEMDDATTDAVAEAAASAQAAAAEGETADSDDGEESSTE